MPGGKWNNDKNHPHKVLSIPQHKQVAIGRLWSRPFPKTMQMVRCIVVFRRCYEQQVGIFICVLLLFIKIFSVLLEVLNRWQWWFIASQVNKNYPYHLRYGHLYVDQKTVCCINCAVGKDSCFFACDIISISSLLRDFNGSRANYYVHNWYWVEEKIGWFSHFYLNLPRDRPDI